MLEGIGNNNNSEFKTRIPTPSIVKGWWTNEKDQSISKAYFGQTVRFHIETYDISNGSSLKLQVYEDGVIKDTKIGNERSVTVNENKAILSFYLRRDWESLINVGADSFDATIELYVSAIYNNGGSVKLADTKTTWLNVTLAKYIYLTFDDGVHSGTEEILNVLQETGVKATFFLTGKNSITTSDRQKLLKRIYEEHAIGNHSYYHANDKYIEYPTQCEVSLKSGLILCCQKKIVQRSYPMIL